LVQLEIKVMVNLGSLQIRKFIDIIVARIY
jgi:hypothetical protein